MSCQYNTLTSLCPGSGVQNFVQEDRVHCACAGDQAGGFIAFFLDRVAGVAARPRPGDLVRFGRSVQPLPEFKVGFAFEQLIHCLDDILRIGNDFDLAGLRERFQPDTGGNDFSLLIGGGTEIFASDLTGTLVFQNGDSTGARAFGAIAQTAAVANDGDLFHEVKDGEQKQ